MALKKSIFGSGSGCTPTQRKKSHSLCLLFRYMAVDRPSVKLLSFLRKHYGLANNIPQVSLSLLLLVRLLPFLFSVWTTLLFFSLVSSPS
jgi:hypothetical protein